MSSNWVDRLYSFLQLQTPVSGVYCTLQLLQFCHFCRLLLFNHFTVACKAIICPTTFTIRSCCMEYCSGIAILQWPVLAKRTWTRQKRIVEIASLALQKLRSNSLAGRLAYIVLISLNSLHKLHLINVSCVLFFLKSYCWLPFPKHLIITKYFCIHARF